MILPYILAAMMGLVTSSEVKTTVNGVETQIEGNPHQIVPIPLPTKKFNCVRLPIKNANDTLTVAVGCADKDNHPLFLVGALCRTDVPDTDVSVLVLQASEDPDKSLPVQIAVQCSTARGPEVL